MRGLPAFLASVLLAALVPLYAPARVTVAAAFPGWPAEYEGRPLTAIPLSPREQRFADGFPGRIATFTDGRRTLVLRFVAEPTRRVHPAAQCFEGAGYEVRAAAGGDDGWGRFIVRRGAETWLVRERIEDAEGRSWPEVSAWYWSAFWGRTRGPWRAITVVEAEKG